MIRLASTPESHVPPATPNSLASQALQASQEKGRTAQSFALSAGEKAESAPEPAAASKVSQSESPCPISSRDWDDLFKAVEERLRQSVTAQAAAAQGLNNPKETALHAIVLDCLEALDMLHNALMRERSQRHQLELDILNAQSRTAQAMALLVSRDVGYSAESALSLRGGQVTRGADAAMQSSMKSSSYQSSQSL